MPSISSATASSRARRVDEVDDGTLGRAPADCGPALSFGDRGAVATEWASTPRSSSCPPRPVARSGAGRGLVDGRDPWFPVFDAIL